MENESTLSQQGNRIVYFDYLRIFASFCVMILHIASSQMSGTDVNTFVWKSMNFYDAVVRWTVPVFVMISGALFLGKEHSKKDIYGKYILRLATAYVFWGFVYALATGGGIKDIIINTIKGKYHMWFIPMIAGLYMCVPILRRFTESKSVTQYFLILCVIFTFAVPTVVQIINDFCGISSIKTLVAACNSVVSNANLYLVLGYTGYFVGGYYLGRTDLSKRARGVVYALGLLGFAATVLLSQWNSVSLQTRSEYYFVNYRLNVMLESLAVFVWFKYNAPARAGRFIRAMSQYSFGAYLVHALIINVLSRHGLTTLTFAPALSIPIIGIIVFVISYAISFVIHQIPYLKKYIV